jgi:hypothetical protein
MLNLFTEALGRYLVSRLSALPEKPVASFALPGAVPGQNAVNLFLSAMAEDMELRSNEPRFERLGLEWVSMPPPIRLKCSYIVSAWPSPDKPSEEAAFIQLQLLSEAYKTMATLKTLPAAFLPGPMADPGLPRPAIALSQDDLSSRPDFWMSAGCTFHPAFTFTASFSMPVTGKQHDHLVEEVQVDYLIK